MNFKISSTKPLSTLCRDNGFLFWEDLVNHVQNLPYGRNSKRDDFSLVIKEKKGSCSSKHAFLAAVAKENNQTNIQLILAMYKMNSQNTNIGNSLENSGLTYIPEAHCYLKINDLRQDITSANSSLEKLKKDILSEEVITPEQVINFKIKYHQDFIKKWIVKENISLSFDKVWSLREKCIQYLSEN